MIFEIIAVLAGVIAICGYWLFGRYFGHVLYLRINSDRYTLRDLTKSVEDSLSAQNESAPFSHPRALVGDFTNAEGLLRKLAKRMGGFTAPQVVVHPQEQIEGGLTQIEERCLRELVVGGTNARRVVVHVGYLLTDSQVHEKLKT